MSQLAKDLGEDNHSYIKYQRRFNFHFWIKLTFHFSMEPYSNKWHRKFTKRALLLLPTVQISTCLQCWFQFFHSKLWFIEHRIRNRTIAAGWDFCSSEDLVIISCNCHDRDLIGHLSASLWQFVNELVLFLIAYLIMKHQHNSISNLYHNCMQRWNVGVYHTLASNHLLFMGNFPERYLL